MEGEHLQGDPRTSQSLELLSLGESLQELELSNKTTPDKSKESGVTTNKPSENETPHKRFAFLCESF